MAKSHKLSFFLSSSTTSSPLELLHSDVWGPSPLTSFNDFRYYIVFIDDYTYFTWIFFMRQKSKVSQIFSSFKSQVENLLFTIIKTLRIDDGMEYFPITKQFPQITYQTSCPYTLEQNGVTERKHRHITELTLAIMSHATLPTIYWDKIFSSTVYLINWLPSPSSNTIPCTNLFLKPPDYSLLRVLGCRCFPHTRPYNSHKLDLRALPCIFIGYAINKKKLSLPSSPY
jgi:hypothetical protein